VAIHSAEPLDVVVGWMDAMRRGDLDDVQGWLDPDAGSIRAGGRRLGPEPTVTRIVGVSFPHPRRPLALSIVLCCTLLLAATAADTRRLRERAAPTRLYEIAGDFVRLDSETLRPVRGQRAPLDSDSWAWSFAPGRGRIALVSDSPGPSCV
jgi:hypothetical protein